MTEEKAYIKVSHPDPKKAREMAKVLKNFANTIAKLTGEPENAQIIEVESHTTEGKG